MSRKGLVLLDRDGVLNSMVMNPDHGTVDSPLHPDQVECFPWVPEALASLTRAGYGLAIVSNQPAAAKGKTTLSNLERVHQRVLDLVQTSGGRILSSHLCFHRSEDGCRCRKPMTGLLESAIQANPGYVTSLSWMVGDGVTDVEAGARLSLLTAYLGPTKFDVLKIFEEKQLQPTFRGSDLLQFAEHIRENSAIVRPENYQ